ncbi:hypothetical protein [Streptomyces sp. BA2]|uniref:hypothetical protein n=1 Tax=Streptomyces sp. BA2 TaxID=436595 RepID=UPI0013264743|nr:hypothetical protein [Streptomyces sp. BA2]MWA07654.1 hypothetical protein [Streptomyces sp. BA2]MWA16273.1 hypothetical protein [Streptomyces sp. BA2]
MLIKPDPSTAAGRAILDLADLMDRLHECSGEWPDSDTVDIVAGWLNRFTFAAPEGLTAQTAGRAWVLRQWDRHTDDVTLWSDEASALASLAQEVRSSWDDVGGTDGVPYRPPADDQAVVGLYYGPEKIRGDAGYTLYPAGISRHVRAPLSLCPSLTDAESCAEANSSAVFHPQESPDDEGLPCIEIAGILVFAYLDADLRKARVSVHLDTTHEQFVRADGTVPIQVEIEDATVFDSLAPPTALPEPTG